jgi:molybdopterin-guanine dinucleotide biosynthesis protein A
LPTDLVARLGDGLQAAHADLACAASGGRAHPVFGLWPVRLREDLRRAIVEEGIRKVDLWTARHRLVTVPFPDQSVDPFFNANRPEDFEAAASLLRVAAG